MNGSRGNGRGSKLSRDLRQARNTVRHFERRVREQPEKETIHRARYEWAVAFLVSQRLITNEESRPNGREAERQ